MDVAEICSDLIKAKSDNPPGDTSGAVGYIRDLLAGAGIRSTVTDSGGGKCNLVTEPAKTGLLLCGHLDVVPALDEGWSDPPYAGIIRDGSVWGRGATDMKGGCAALLSAFLRSIEGHGEIPAQLAFVCDEETGGESGIRQLLSEELIRPCDCLIAEPTPARHPSIGQKGLVRLGLRFSGTPAHGSLYPVIGRSAIVEALALVDFLPSLRRKTYAGGREMEGILVRSSRVLGEEFGLAQASEVLTGVMFNPGVIAGGEKSNIVAQSCDLDLEMRIPWGCDIRELVEEVMGHAPHARILSQVSHPPSLTKPDCRIVTATCEAVRKVYGGEASPIVQWAASDARHLRGAGFRVVEYGPGNLRTLHAVNEHVTTASLEHAIRVYCEILQSYAAPG